jgi:hypothetical protein
MQHRVIASNSHEDRLGELIFKRADVDCDSLGTRDAALVVGWHLIKSRIARIDCRTAREQRMGPGGTAVVLERAYFWIESDQIALCRAHICLATAVLDEVVSEGGQIPREIRALNGAGQIAKVGGDDRVPASDHSRIVDACATGWVTAITPANEIADNGRIHEHNDSVIPDTGSYTRRPGGIPADGCVLQGCIAVIHHTATELSAIAVTDVIPSERAIGHPQPRMILDATGVNTAVVSNGTVSQHH